MEEIDDTTEQRATIGALLDMVRNVYLEATEHGFTDAQAMTIAVTWMQEIIRGGQQQ